MSASGNLVRFPRQADEGAADEAVVQHIKRNVLERSKSAFLSFLVFSPALILALFICFNNLDWGTLTIPDEVYEVQASIEMMQGDRWWIPTHNGEPWLHKPPLKMWMSWPAIKYLSSPNIAFRLLDALTGIAMCSILFFFSLNLFSSRLAALSTSLAFLGCDILIRYHGVRSANQDAMLTLFTTIALVAAWKLIAGTHDSNWNGAKLSRSALVWSFIGGLAVAAAVVTKSAAGLLAFIIAGGFCLLSGRFAQICKRAGLGILIALSTAVIGFCAYFLPVFLIEEGSFGEYITENIYGRVLSGYHSIEGPWFYLERLFPERAAVPPELLVLGLAVCLFQWLKNRDERFGYVFVWSALPVACFSVSKIKLSWYIASSLLGMSLLVGALVYVCQRALLERSPGVVRRWIYPVASSFVLIAAIPLLSENLKLSVQATYRDKGNIPFDTLVKEVREWEVRQDTDVRVAFFDSPAPSLREQPYRLLLEGETLEGSQREELDGLIKAGELDLVFTSVSQVPELLSLASPSWYASIPPDHSRSEWFAVFGYSEGGDYTILSRTASEANFGTGSVNVLSGFATPDGFGETPIRWMLGDEAEFLLPGSKLWRNNSTDLELTLAPHAGYPEVITLTVSVNNQRIKKYRPSMHAFGTYHFDIAPGVLHAGDNLVRFEIVRKNRGPIGPKERLMMVDKVRISLKDKSASRG